MSAQQREVPAADDPIVAPLCAIFRRFLKKHGLKFTAERALILDAVLEKDGLFEADELLYEMRAADHRVSKATIYRTLRHMVEAGLVREVFLDSKLSHYQMTYGRKPMDCLVNPETEEVVEFYSPELVELRDKICEEHGLEPMGHRLVIYGLKKRK